MPAEPVVLFDLRRAVQLFSAYDYFNHLRLNPLPVTDLSALTLQFDMEILPVNGEDAAAMAAWFASAFNATPGVQDLVTCFAAGNVVTVSLKALVSGPVVVWFNSGSVPATLSQFVPGQYTARVSSSTVLVRRGEDSSTPQSWPAGTRIQRISNFTLTGDRTLKAGGDAPRIEESDGRCRYEGFWEDYRYGAAWPTQWWSLGHAKRCAPTSASDLRRVTIRYSYPRAHDLSLGTWLGRDAGRIEVTIDGDAPALHDLYLNDYNGLAAMKRLATVLPGRDAHGRDPRAVL
jgi:hypothetical protein